MENTNEKDALLKLMIARAQLLQTVKLAKQEYGTLFNRFRLYTPKEIQVRVDYFDKLIRKSVVDRTFQDNLLTPFMFVREHEIMPKRYGQMNMLEGEMDFVAYCMKPVNEWARLQTRVYDELKNNIKTIVTAENELKEMGSTQIDSEKSLDKKTWPKDEPKNGKELVSVVKKCENYLIVLGEDTQIDAYAKLNSY